MYVVDCNEHIHLYQSGLHMAFLQHAEVLFLNIWQTLNTVSCSVIDK
jgi:hypothetical protein